MFECKHYELLAQGNNPGREFPPFQGVETDCRAYWCTLKIVLALCPILGILIFAFWEALWLGFSILIVIILFNLK
ncbi:MAG: hypothetical protein WC449_03440 [Candidatus Paceibacterota bacterium]